MVKRNRNPKKSEAHSKFAQQSFRLDSNGMRGAQVSLLVRGLAGLSFVIGIAMLLPGIVALIFGESSFEFFIPGISLCILSAPFLAMTRHLSGKLSIRGSFLLVTGAWIIACSAGSLPFFLTGVTPKVADALFESASGFTTTGSSVFADVESLPRSILFWRSLTHWIGGMGIIVLAVAVLPFLNISGYHLFQAEAPGMEVERLVPRISHTARYLWIIYVVLTGIEILLLIAGGMGLFDAVNHAFATLATGGFSTKNSSISAFDSPYIEWVITVFMFLSGINFALYYRAVIGDFQSIKRNSELKAYVTLFLLSMLAVALSLRANFTYTSMGETVRKAGFQVATLMTSTGFSTSNFDVWPGIARGVLLLMLFIGGCAGSTSGGIKVVYVVVMAKLVPLHLRRLIYPQGVFVPQFNRFPIAERTIIAISGFIFLYISVVLLSTVVVMSSGADTETALTASLAAIGNIGPGFAGVGPSTHFGWLPSFVKIWLSLVMIIGRLEVYAILVAIRALLRSR